MADKLTREDCIQMLAQQYEKLKQQEAGRYPKRADFSEEQVVAIKAFLGPWPRALEAAGIKPPREVSRKEKNQQKRIRAKRRRNAEKNLKQIPHNAVSTYHDPNNAES